MQGASLIFANFDEANVEGTDFSGADCYGANFKGVDASQAKGLKDALNLDKALFLDLFD